VNQAFMKSLEVPITIETDCESLGEDTDVETRIRDAVIAAAHRSGFSVGSIGVLITDDETIHRINREHLEHDYPTDVISFAYHQQLPSVEGELVASLDTAAREASSLGWTTLNELLLYVIHGTLHICGLDDQTEEARKEIRLAERQVLATLGILNASDFDPDAEPDAVDRHRADTHSRVDFS
jgi:probable rRNA maturation factor